MSKAQYNKTHEGWKFFKGINHDRLSKGKTDEVIVMKKIISLNQLPKDCEFLPTKSWNNRVDFKSLSGNISIEIKRRFLNASDEYPFKLDKTKGSTLLTMKKFQHLKDNNGWLYLQYNDSLMMAKISELKDDDWVECWPFRVQHVSIRLDRFTVIDSTIV